jgi:hypothetical protein
MRGEELAIDSLTRHLPRHMLDTVLADIQMEPFAVIGPGAAWAVETTVLVIHP